MLLFLAIAILGVDAFLFFDSNKKFDQLCQLMRQIKDSSNAHGGTIPFTGSLDSITKIERTMVKRTDIDGLKDAIDKMSASSEIKSMLYKLASDNVKLSNQVEGLSEVLLGLKDDVGTAWAHRKDDHHQSDFRQEVQRKKSEFDSGCRVLYVRPNVSGILTECSMLDSYYKIELLDDESGNLYFNCDLEYAMANKDEVLTDVCSYEVDKYQSEEFIQVKKGVVSRQQNGAWVVVEKVIIRVKKL